MLTPEELHTIIMDAKQADLERAFKDFSKKAEKAAKEGQIQMYLDPPKIQGLYYNDERQEFFAMYLRDKGFKCIKKSEVSGGVRQDPAWYVMF